MQSRPGSCQRSKSNVHRVQEKDEKRLNQNFVEIASLAQPSHRTEVLNGTDARLSIFCAMRVLLASASADFCMDKLDALVFGASNERLRESFRYVMHVSIYE